MDEKMTCGIMAALIFNHLTFGLSVIDNPNLKPVIVSSVNIAEKLLEETKTRYTG